MFRLQSKALQDPNDLTKVAAGSNELTFEEKESFLLNSYEESSQTAKKFLSVFFSKCKTKQADFDLRPIFENFIQDLLTTVNQPEWPVSEIILNLLGKKIFFNKVMSISVNFYKMHVKNEIFMFLKKSKVEKCGKIKGLSKSINLFMIALKMKDK